MNAIFSALMSGATPYILGASILFSSVGAGWVVHRMDGSTLANYQLAEARRDVDTITSTKKAQENFDKTAMDAAVTSAESQQKIVEKTNTIIRRITEYVSVKSDDNCIVPIGLIRLFNAAAPNAYPDSSTPNDTWKPNDSASGMELNSLAAAIAQNLGRWKQDDQQLIDLQNLVRQYQEQTK